MRTASPSTRNRPVKDHFAAETVAGRAGTAEKIAKAVAFFASNDTSFVSGHGLLGDGGCSVA